jgi:PBSX family phage terminase large subunit
MIVYRPHSAKQDLAIFSKKKIKIVATGIQWGKTKSSALAMKMAMHTHTNHDDNFIMAAPNYKIMQQATLPEFLHIMQGYGTYSKTDACFKMHNGGTCWMRTGTDANSVVGITRVKMITGDEAGLFSLYFHENLIARSSFSECPVMYTTSPYSLNWIYKDYIRPRLKDPNFMIDELELIQARSNENPYFPAEEFERRRKTMDPKRFNMIYGGQFDKLEGLVYSCFDEENHVITPKVLDHRTIYVAGVDWGYTNPACILVFGVTPEDGVFLVSEFYKTGKGIGDIVEHAKRLNTLYNIERFYCDPSSPANIAEFHKAKLTAIPADNDIRPGIDACFELIASNKFHVFAGVAPNFLDEISMYHYPSEVDVTADKDVKEQLPVKQYDHSLDAFRYVVFAMHQTRGLFNKRIPKVAQQKNIDMSSHLVDDLLKRRVTQQEYDW